MAETFWFKARFAWGSSFELLDDSELASLMRAIWTYAETGEKLPLTGKAAFLWPMISTEIRQDSADRVNGSKGGRPRKTENPGFNPGKPPPSTKQSREEQSREEQSREEQSTISSADGLSAPAEKPRKTKKETPGFDSFYAAYPKHAGKANALKAWNALAPDEALQARIMAAIQVQRASPSWTKDGGQFIPLPATWLRGRRWEDEQQTAPEVSRFAGIDLGVTL